MKCVSFQIFASKLVMALKISPLLIFEDFHQHFPKDGEESCPITPGAGWLLPGTADMKIPVSLATNFLI